MGTPCSVLKWGDLRIKPEVSLSHHSLVKHHSGISST